MATKPNVVFVLGAPGSGKGTQCQKIVEKFGYVHLSAGDLLRAEQNTSGSPYGELIATRIKEGRIVPVEITCSLLMKAMEKSEKNDFLIDGFPRNQDNLDGWEKEAAGNVHEKFMLFIDCPEQICIDRCLNRGTGGSGRTDDNVESLKKRFDTFHHDTMPVVKHYEKKGMVVTVNGCNDPDSVFEFILEAFKRFQDKF